MKASDLLRASARLHNLRQLAAADDLAGLAYRIDLAATEAASLAEEHSIDKSAWPGDETDIALILTALRHLRETTLEYPSLTLLIDVAIEEGVLLMDRSHQ